MKMNGVAGGFAADEGAPGQGRESAAWGVGGGRDGVEGDFGVVPQPQST